MSPHKSRIMLILGAKSLLTEGLVISVEPIIAAGTGRQFLDADGWTVRTADRTPAAHYEHTIVITKGMPILLTSMMDGIGTQNHS